MKISKQAKERFDYFSKCEDAKRLPAIAYSEGGYSALECFHSHETYGKELPCREPELLSRALNGKEWHGLTVTNCAEDYLSLIHISEPTRPISISYAVFCLKKRQATYQVRRDP